jgi:adenine-specific DNA-methyltransferase
MATKNKAENAKKIDGLSTDVRQEKNALLKQVAPEIFADGKIDVAKLKKLTGEEILADDERYRLEWAGKSQVFDEIAERSSCTLTLDPKRSSKDWEKSGNIFIEGENLEVLRVMQKAYHGKVKMIYIDPPYNTGKDFVYNDNFKQTEEEYCEDECNVDENGLLKKAYKLNSRDSGRFHSNWLSMMYPRLYLARNLMRDDGIIFVSIDDNEVHNLRQIMSEIFGEENFIADIVWEKRYTRSNDAKLMASVVDHTILFRKSQSLEILREPRTEKADSIYTNPDKDPRGAWTSVSYVGQRTKDERPNLIYKVYNPKKNEWIEHPTNAWKFSKERYEQHAKEDRLYWGVKGENAYPRLKKYLSEVSEQGMVPVNLWKYKETGTVDEGTKEVDELVGKDVFDYPKPTSLVERMLGMATGNQENEIVLDFFTGSGTTAHAVMKQNAKDGVNRRYICVQMPEETPLGSEARKIGYKKISDIAINRIKKAAAQIKQEHPEYKGDLGMRVYRESESHFPQWHSRAFENDADLKQAMIDYDKQNPSGTPEDRAIEILLKLGYPLTTPLENKKGYFVTSDGVALVLDSATNVDSLSKILDEEVKTVVVLEKIFKKDEQKINFGLRCKEAGVTLQTV